MSDQRVALAITGASGSVYGLRLMECLLQLGCRVEAMISSAGRIVLETELDLTLAADSAAASQQLQAHFGMDADSLTLYGKEDWFAPVASGSNPASAMVVCPCSMGTLSAIAHGSINNLIERAADVMLKERRPLILVPREAPYSEIHLENMLRLTRMGAVMLPASPGFYHRPTEIAALVDFVVARILDQLGITHQLVERWSQ